MLILASIGGRTREERRAHTYGGRRGPLVAGCVGRVPLAVSISAAVLRFCLAAVRRSLLIRTFGSNYDRCIDLRRRIVRGANQQ